MRTQTLPDDAASRSPHERRSFPALRFLLALLPPVVVAVVLGMRWSSIPQRFPIHWGLDGQADGWATRSAGSVFALPVLALGLVVFMATLVWLVKRFAPDQAAKPQTMRLMRDVLGGAAWLLALLFSAFALQPLFHPTAGFILALSLCAVGAAIALVIYAVYQSVRVSKALDAAQGATLSQSWRVGGLVYVNRNDPALFIPRRIGLGYTINFGRPAAWILLLLIALLPLCLVFCSRLLR